MHRQVPAAVVKNIGNFSLLVFTHREVGCVAEERDWPEGCPPLGPPLPDDGLGQVQIDREAHVVLVDLVDVVDVTSVQTSLQVDLYRVGHRDILVSSRFFVNNTVLGW